MLRYVLLATCALVAACATTSTTQDNNEVEFLTTPAIEAAGFPFSDAVRVGNLLFLSGKIGNVPGESKLAPGGIQGETRQTLDNIKTSLERYGASMDQVVKCTVFLADIAEWGAMNEIYKQYFLNNKPARSALGSSGLALNARVEIECIAALD